MPRQARIDAPGALHHIICRGIERKQLFKNNADRDDFVERLSTILSETSTPCYAWALIPNHFHLLLRTGNVPIATIMRRLLTGYAVSFNRRYDRHGHLFQNRYKSILCQEDPYFLELVRYIHLNPLRADLVKSLKELDSYPYSGHSRLMKKVIDQWQDTETILLLFEKKESIARKRYREFIEKGLAQGRRQELTGGGLVRSAGGWGVLKSENRMKEHLKGDERILGDSDFVLSVLNEAEESTERKYRFKAYGYNFESILQRVSELLKVPIKEILMPGKQPLRVKARSIAAYWAVRELGIDGTTVGEKMGLSQSAISRAVQRGEKLVLDLGYQLEKRIIS
ncbi:MAG: transposase [Deltaproteobacteria bacterium]|nr:transposase [Deltaproteobacteria bacterium]MBW2215886.1 transposase [Deltaproteobacteria bacterium]